jgi:hypothetical protein
MNSITASLGDMANAYPALSPSAAAQARWTGAIRSAAKPVVSPPHQLVPAVYEWWHEVVWSSRRVWTGLAAVWLLVLVGHLPLREQRSAVIARTEPPSREMIMAYRDQQAFLSELLADHSTPPDADRPKSFAPKPRTEKAHHSYVNC